LKVLPRKTLRNFSERSSCMCPELRATTNGDMGIHCGTGKRRKKTKEAHDSIMTTFYFLFNLFNFIFGGKFCQFVPTQHTIYTLL
jgi:hypothetical protein